MIGSAVFLAIYVGLVVLFAIRLDVGALDSAILLVLGAVVGVRLSGVVVEIALYRRAKRSRARLREHFETEEEPRPTWPDVTERR